MAHRVGDVVYYDDNRLMVEEGPFRTLDQPNVDQYRLKTPTGYTTTAWGPDLMTVEEYFDHHAEEGCRE